jgi:hypothetical protein
MACFLVPTATALIATAVRQQVKEDPPKASGISWRRKFSWLLNLMWGGAILLALEHLWHGEVMLAPPFLTAMNDPANTAVMLRELSTVGVGMAAIVVLAWLGMILVADRVAAVRRVVRVEVEVER